MIRAARKDANHKQIADYLLDHGASVGDLSQVKKLCDIAVAFRGVTELVEIKNGALPPSGRKLTEGEQQFHDRWRATVHIVIDLEDAKQLLLLMERKSKTLRLAGII